MATLKKRLKKENREKAISVIERLFVKISIMIILIGIRIEHQSLGYPVAEIGVWILFFTGVLFPSIKSFFEAVRDE